MSIRKIRKQTLSLSSYLDKVREEDVRSDQEVQRLSGAWDAGMVNELVATVLTDDYIPPIILGEEQLTDAVQQWIIDGLQRSSSLLRFRYGNCRITSAIENSRIEYQKKKLDASGKICRDEDDNIIWESMQFDIRGKTFDELPAELKKNFDDYQIEMVIHQDCTMDMISKLVRRYNNHKPMNAAQRAFTYLDKYARKIRGITEHRFFKDCGEYTETEKKNGVYERIVAESVMAMFHLDHWQKNGKKIESEALSASGTDALSDALATSVTIIAAIISLFSSFPIDGWAGIVVSVFIMYAGVRSVVGTVSAIVGERPSKETVKEIRSIIACHPPLSGGYDIQIHTYGPSRMIGTCNVEVPYDARGEEIFDAMTDAQVEIMDRMGIYFTFGMYAVNSDNPVVIRIFKGIRPVVVALIAAPMVRMSMTNNSVWWQWAIMLAALAMTAFLSISPIYIMLCIIVMATAVTVFREKRPGNNTGRHRKEDGE